MSFSHTLCRPILPVASVLLITLTLLAWQPAETPPAAPPAPAAGAMVSIPAGPVWVGCKPELDSKCKPDEQPGRKVQLDAFSIDRTEVTVAQYRACVDAGACQPPRSSGEYDNWGKPGRDLHPVNAVNWTRANAYCTWAGKRLPTEAEWERAARGDTARTYPWGEQRPSCELAVVKEGIELGCGLGSTHPVGSKPDGDSPFGVADMGGNVREWTADWYAPHNPRHTTNPKGPADGKVRVYKGGSFFLPARKKSRVATRHKGRAAIVNLDVGFRCARDGG